MLGTTSVQIEIGKIPINYKVIVIDNLCKPVLIGLDIIKKNQRYCRPKNNVILFTYNGNDVRLNIGRENQIIVCSKTIIKMKKIYLERKELRDKNIRAFFIYKNICIRYIMLLK